MALRRKNQLTERKPNSLIAAAAVVQLDRDSWMSAKLDDQEWQQQAWRFYDIVGELRYVANSVGNAISRCRLYAAEVDEQGRAADEATDKAVQLTAETMFGGPAARAEALRAIGVHLFTPGECYIVALSPADVEADKWYVVSKAELKKTADGIKIDRPDLPQQLIDPESDLIIRIWTPHPRRNAWADSPVRAVLPVLTEIEQLTKHVFATIDSRLAGAGILMLPDEMDFPIPDGSDKAETISRKLSNAAAASLKDEGTAAALVPIVMTAPGELLDKVKHLKWESQLTADTKELRDAAIRRLALGLDIDPEVLLGLGDTNHWSAWQIEESTVKTQIEPLLTRIVDGLTEAYLRPALEAQGIDPDGYTLWYDTSPLTVRPNRLADAENLYDRGAISDAALLVAGAFDESDAPDDAERTRRLLLALMDKAPDYAPAILRYLGIEVPGLEAPAPAPQPAEQSEPGQEPNDREIPEQPTESAPEPAALLVCDQLVMTALSRAGGKLLTRELRGRYQNVPRYEMHKHVPVDPSRLDWYLEGAWDLVPRYAQQLGVDPRRLRAELDRYVRDLLIAGQLHEHRYLRRPVASIGAA